MFTGKYKIAGRVVQVSSIYSEVHEYCADYASNEPADFSVATTQADIDYESRRSEREDIAMGREVQHYSDSYLEELAVYRKIATKMVDHDTILFHGSVIAVDGEGYIFTAKSGTGKSTHTRLWREMFGERAVMVNDDKPLLRITESGVIAYGTPYNGKHRLGSNIAVPLKAVCILTRSDENHIAPISKTQAYPMLIQQTYRPDDAEKMRKTLSLIDQLAGKTALYRLGCNMEPDAARVSYEGMQ